MRASWLAPLAVFLSSCFWTFDLQQAGCLDEDGRAWPGTDPSACGAGGALCDTCSGALSACIAGVCTPENAPVSIAVGTQLSCAVDTRGGLWCWGQGVAMRPPSASPVRMELTVPVERAAIAASRGGEAQAMCAMPSSGPPVCWGANGEGELGVGHQESPVELPGLAVVSPGTRWEALSLGSYAALGVVDGALYGWGFDGTGRTGRRALPTRVAVPTRADGVTLEDWTWVALHQSHGCAIRDPEGTRALFCFGSNASGQLGAPTTVEQADVTPVEALPRGWTDVAVGREHTCGVREDGGLYCFGALDGGRIGRSGSGPQPTPTRVAVEHEPYRRVVVGDAFTCALNERGEIWCFGDNASGQLGLPTTTPSSATPARVLAGHTIVELAVAERHGCALTRERRLFCWGDNGYGQLGAAGFGTSPEPIEVVLGR